MKKIIFIAILSCGFLASQAFALEIVAYNTSDGDYLTNVENWITAAGGYEQLIEDFEGEALGWYDSLMTSVGLFTAEGLPGTGASSYMNSGEAGANSTDVKFSISDNTAWSRKNTTPGGTQWLDSGDITQISLVVSQNVNNLYFYLSDPSDVGATTRVSSGNDIYDWDYRQANGSLWFVGISSPDAFIDTITWSTGNYTNDGFGLDDFTAVSAAPVPEPATILLLGTGLLGLAGASRKKFKK